MCSLISFVVKCLYVVYCAADGTTIDANNTAMRRISMMLKGLDYRLNNPELERARIEADQATAGKNAGIRNGKRTSVKSQNKDENENIGSVC